MKIIWIFLLSSLLMNVFAGEGGGSSRVGGGGDPSEARVNNIRKELLEWIDQGGARWIQFPQEMNQNLYETRMKEILVPQAVMVSFTPESVFVNGMPKTCRGYIELGLAYIQCHIQRFKATSKKDQYRLIHHEYAGLAGIEKNDGAASDYEISNQLLTKKFQSCGLRGDLQKRIQDCEKKGSVDQRQKYIEMYGWSKVVEYQDGLRIYLQGERLWAFYVSAQSASLAQAKKSCDLLSMRKGLLGVADWHLPDHIELFNGITWGLGEVNEDVRADSYIWIQSPLTSGYGFQVKNQFPTQGFFAAADAEMPVGAFVCTSVL